VLKIIFGLKREREIMLLKAGDSFQNEEFHNLYSLQNVIRMIKWMEIRWARHVICMREMRNAYRIVAGKSEGKRPHVGPKRR